MFAAADSDDSGALVSCDVAADTSTVKKRFFASVLFPLVRLVLRRRPSALATALVVSMLCAARSLAALEIYRPENHGALNTIPCLIRVTDEDGADASDRIRHISYNWYYEMPLPNWSRQPKMLNRYFNGCFTGGVVVHLLMQPGRYLISVTTPVEKQQDYVIAERHSDAAVPRAWVSNTFLYDTAHRPNVVFVSPTANDNGFFNGGWHIDYRAPRYYRFTKPYRTE